MSEVKYAIAILKEKLGNADKHNLHYQRLSIADMEAIWGVLSKCESDYAELKAQRDALAAENAALKDGAEYFMYGPDCGFERYDSQDEAVKAANEMIDSYREDAGDGWCDEVEQVCFGIVISYSRQHDVQQPSEDNGFLGSVDYMMSAPKTPATDAYLNSVRADAVQALWDDSLNDVGHVLEEIGAYQDASEAGGIVHSEIQERVDDFVAQLRAGKDGE